MPKRINNIPIQDVSVSDSCNKNTPSNAAVSGSASANVTAVDDVTYFNPLENKKYANAVVTSPKCKLTAIPFTSVIHDISKIKRNGDRNNALSENITATTDREGCF